MLRYMLFCLLTTVAFDMQGMESADAKGKQLYVVVGAGKIEDMRRLLGQGANVNFRDTDGSTALHVAAFKGDHDILNILIQAKADLNLQDKFGFTPLMEAVTNGNLDAVKALVAAGADLTLKDKEGKMAHEMGLSLGIAKLVKPVAAPAKATQETKQVVAATRAGAGVESEVLGKQLFEAVYQDDLTEVERLLKLNPLVNWQDEMFGYTPLIMAAGKASATILNALLKIKDKGSVWDNSKLNLDTQDKDGNTALMTAVSLGRLDRLVNVKALVNAGANLGIKNNKGQTAYDIAVGKGIPEIIVEVVLPSLAGTWADERAEALYEAVRGNNIEDVRNILKLKPNINWRNDRNNRTVLMLAAERGNKDIVQALIAAGPDLTLKDPAGKTALMIADFYAYKGDNFREVAALLKAAEAPAGAAGGAQASGAVQGASDQLMLLHTHLTALSAA